MRLPATVRHTARSIQRRPILSTFLIGTLTLGIASTTVMFSILDGVLLRALPYPEPQRLVTVWQTYPHWRNDPVLADFWDRVAFSWDDYQAVRAHVPALESVGGFYAVATPVFRPDTRPEQVVVAKASPSLMPLLGAQPVLGRWLSAAEEGPGAPRVALLSYDEWIGRWGGSREVVGRTLRIGSEAFEVIGVLPRGLDLRSLHPRGEPSAPALWIPIGTNANDLVPYSQNYELIARLAPAATTHATEEQVFAALAGKHEPGKYGTRALPRLEAEAGSTRPMLLLLSAAVVLMLLLALANVAALLLGDRAGRELELATRSALGATPGRIARDVMIETGSLAVVAASLAIFLAQLGTRALLALAPMTLPHTDRIGVDPRVLAFTAGIAVVSAIGIGLAPALAARRTALWSFGISGRVTRTPRYEYALLGAQVAISTVLLAAAALVGRSLATQVTLEPGFRTEDVMAVRVRTGSRPDATAQRTALDEQLRRLRAVPGVLDASITTAMPYREPGNTWSIELDATRKFSSASPSAVRITVGPRFFETMDIPIVEGRSITAAENSVDSAGLVVNEAFVRRFGEGRPMLGHSIRTPAGVFRVIGVARDTRPVGLEIAPEPTFYLPFGANTTSRLTFVVRARPGASPAPRVVHDVLASIDPEVTIIETRPVAELLHDSLADERYRTMLLGIFAAMATLISAVGLAGTTLRALERRRKELCVRLSLGATPVRAATTLVGRPVLSVIAGVALGTLAAVPAGRIMQSYLPGIAPADALSIALGSIGLMASAAAALAVPLRRLWRTDLAKVLRDV